VPMPDEGLKPAFDTAKDAAPGDSTPPGLSIFIGRKMGRGREKGIQEGYAK